MRELWVPMVFTNQRSLWTLVVTKGDVVLKKRLAGPKNTEVCEWMTNQAVYDVAWSEVHLTRQLLS